MYTPLYIKTDNSLLSSMIKIDDLILFAKENNLKSLTITDNNMYGVMEFYHKCLDNAIKPIVGLEAKIDNYKFLIYCKNYNGYKNLIKISTALSDNSFDYVFLSKFCSDLVCIVLYDSIDILYSKLEKLFCDIYKGYSNSNQRDSLTGSNLVYVNEILYLTKNDGVYYKYLLGIRDGHILEQVNYIDNNYLYIPSNDKYLENNFKINEMCNLEIVFNMDLLPIYECPDNLDSFSYLRRLSIDGLKRLFGETVSKKYIDRLKYELDIINKMGFCNYFLVVYDYVRFAKENGILVGPGRGSAAGSLVAYCLNITTIDPIKHDLLFERFLNPERISMPDIDIDFEYDRREEVIDYCRVKYGKVKDGNKRVVPIITFGTLGAKQVVRDVGRVMDIDLNIVNNLAKLLDSRLDLRKNYDQNKKISDLLKINKDLFDLYKIAIKLEGLKRHKTIHAAGIVMSRYDLDEVIPLDLHSDGLYLTGYPMEYLEKIGLLKMDFLALKNLSIITDVIKQVSNCENVILNFDDIPFNDRQAMSIFTNCYTLGIFQFESSGMMNYLHKFKADSFDDIVALLALFRPGPMQNIDTYIKRKHGELKIDYLHPDLEEILKPTYGIIVYQEQIMQIAVKLAGYSLGEADVLRKAMSKKKREVLLNEKEKFVKQSVDNGYDVGLATKVFDFILKFAEYGFNKAHSVSYGVIAYRMAYLKAHYTVYFMKSLLSSVMGSDVKTKDYLYECKLLNINLLLPDINISTSEYSIENNSLRFPLSGIKNVGETIVMTILKERENSNFKDIFDFVKRVYGKNINSKTIQSLNHAGCFLSLGLNEKTVDNNLDLIINYGEIGELLDDDSLKPVLSITEEYSNKEIMKNELEVFGFYLSKHPVTEYKLRYKTIDLSHIKDYFDKYVDVIVYVDRIRMVKTKDNNNMCFLTGSDEVTNLDIVLFPKIYEQYNNISVGDILKINGKVEKRFDQYQLVVRSIQNMED